MRLNTIVKVTIILFILLSMPMIVVCKEIDLPSEWRFPTDADFIGEWEEYKENNPEPFLAEADFDGNGEKDSAWILIKDDGSWGLFVILNPGSKSYELIQLDETDKGSRRYVPPQSMGLSVGEKGEFKTACGKGFFDCDKGEPDEIVFDLPIINYFQYESASSTFYWDRKTKSFKEIWMSD